MTKEVGKRTLHSAAVLKNYTQSAKGIKKALLKHLQCCEELFEIVKGSATIVENCELQRHKRLNDTLDNAFSFYSSLVLPVEKFMLEVEEGEQVPQDELQPIRSSKRARMAL